VHLLIVCTAERGLCGAFNTSIVRLARERARADEAEGKTVKILLRRPQGLRPAAPRSTPPQIVERSICAASARSVRECRDDRRKDHHARCSRRASSTSARCSIRASVGDRADPDRAADHPAGVRREAADALGGAATSTSRTRRHPARAAAAQSRRADLRALLENAASFYGAQMTAMDNATRNAGDMIRKQTLNYNRTRQAMITKELIEIISGAEAL
jgi:F-type H+-transporting ATPase subunit gamma